ncbi:MAG: hypothetical protein CVV44_18810 [Spirochaetae bacterium HGW-Spirochaetae-1]|jgi:NAD-dependent dihydropyrimidine dehydrogenase PreA subunit|nr:MAG: hypothetical protein CVV44_18810 [Spirochaetae bacterium HGW-Spirochaetae-1]
MINPHALSYDILPIITALTVVTITAHVAFSRERTVPIGRIHYFFHWLYGKYEPQVLILTDRLMGIKLIYGNPLGRAFRKLIAIMAHFLPHGIIVTTRAASNLVRYIESLPGTDEGPRLAVGPCVCQMSLDRWKEPSCKDIVVLYGADIYLHLDRGYRIIDAEEAVEILETCRDAGLVHALDFCMQSGKWHFVICNCDSEICVPVRVYCATKKMLYPGPEAVSLNKQKCLGPKKCGKCIAACMFMANYISEGIVYADAKKCMGCGQCVRVCRGNAREMIPVGKYKHDHVIPMDILIKTP